MEDQDMLSKEKRREMIHRFLHTGNKEYAVQFLKELSAAQDANDTDITANKVHAANDVYFGAMAYLKELGCSVREVTAECGDIEDLMRLQSFPEHAQMFMLRILQKCLTFRDEKTEKEAM